MQQADWALLLCAFFKAIYWVFEDKDPKNLSPKSQLCEASMQTHACMRVCAMGIHLWTLSSYPLLAYCSSGFKAFLTIHPHTWDCKKFIYLSIHRRPWNLSPSWNFSYVKHTQTHALVCHGKSASCNAHTLVCNGESVSHINAHCFFLPTAAAPK